MDLVFSRTRYVPGDPLDLVFGSTDTEPILPLTVQGTIVLGALGVSGVALYDNRLPSYVSAASVSRHQAAAQADAQRTSPWSQPDPASRGSDTPWQSADRADAAPGSSWASTDHAAAQGAAPWQSAASVGRSQSSRYQVCIPVEFLREIGWQAATPLSTALLSRHQVADVLQVLLVASASTGVPLSAGVRSRHQVATPAQRALRARWQAASRLLPPGLSVYVPPGGGGLTPHAVSLDLVFACSPYQAGAPLDLVFGHVCLPPVGPSAPFYILPARFYMAVHSLQAWRLPDMTPIPLLEFTYQAARGSFGWAFDLATRRSAFDDLAPIDGVPALVRVEFDGIRFDMKVDERGFDEAFGGRATKISCSSLTGAIASGAPESQRLNTLAATAQQLALQALDLTGISLDWQLADWLVPAGAWSHSGTPLAAVQAIVDAAGGYLQSHRYLPLLQALHPYPDLAGGILGGPWNWSNPAVAADVELASSALVTLGVKDAIGPDLNGVYMSGAQQGVLGLYKRTGSAADKLATPVTEPLMTAVEAVRQRGRSIVGAAGAKQSITVTAPVLTGPSQPGVIDVGTLLQVNAAQPWRGMVRGVSGRVKFGAEVRQTLEIERHLGA